jgi:outer membrane receptor protein involved in Fe transport
MVVNCGQMRKLLFNVLTLLTTTVSYAQTLRGKVVEQQNQASLTGAVIFQKGTSNGASSDYDGEFSIKVSGLPVTLVVKYVGFADQEIVARSTDFILVEMITGDFGPTVIIRDTRITEKQKQNPLTVERMDLTAIKNSAAGNFYEGLGALKGVDLTTASLGFRVINTRGFNSTSPVRSLQLIDGVDNQSPGLNFSLGNFLGAPDLDVFAVEIVQGASSAFYGPGAFNGVIKMETKDPFVYTGLTAQLRVGERQLVEPSVRFAHAFSNKEGHKYLAYKFNVFAFKALDWAADNQSQIYNGGFSSSNPGRFDAVNTYGDEYFPANDFSTSAPWNYPGLGTFFRTGYRETDLVDYNTKNVKANASVHLRLKPELEENSPELIVAGNVGQGTTVYQGDNRFSLRDILFYQGRVELKKKDKYFIRIYGTGEDAGKSFDPYFTALKLQDAARSDENWAKVYEKYWIQIIKPRALALDYPGLVQNPNWVGPALDPLYLEYNLPYDYSAMAQWNQTYSDSLIYWHSLIENMTNNGTANIPSVGPYGFFQPGSAKFNSNFDRITSSNNNDADGGTRFYDRSSLFHTQGEYQWKGAGFIDYRIGGNARLYRPNSAGTIFTDDSVQIFNYEGGLYFGATRKFMENRLIVSGTVRLDKNVNFDALISPAASVVFQPKKNHYLRASFSSALRNPTLTDQYLSLNVGPAILNGNLNGVDRLYTLESFNDFRNNDLIRTYLDPFSIAPIRPEQVKTMELGYRASFFDQKVYVDLGGYYSAYKDFIGYKIGIDVTFDPDTMISIPTNLQVYRYSANSTNTVNTQGATIGLNYYFHEKHSFGANYSFNSIVRSDPNDPIIPAFNTPKHKYNLSVTGNKLFESSEGNCWGYSVNYKWIQGYLFEGSPQFTGYINTYDMVDVQVNYTMLDPKSAIGSNVFFKLGASNVLNNQQVQVYGGPSIGRMAYLSIQYSFNHQKSNK